MLVAADKYRNPVSKVRGKYGNGSVYQPKHPGESVVPAERNWYVAWYDKDGKKQRATKGKDGQPFWTEKLARDFLKLQLADAVKGIAPTNGNGLHYADLRELVLKHHRQNSSKSLRLLANGEETICGLTALDVYGGLRNDINSPLLEGKGRKLSTITKDDWYENFIVSRYKDGVGRAAINHSAKLLRHGLRLAKQEHLVNEITVLPEASPREDCLYIEDFLRLIDGEKYIGNEFHDVLKFLFYQGVRVTETLGITWNQFESGEFHPHATSNKTGNTEAKPLNPAEILPMLKKMRGDASETDLVFGAARSEGDDVANKLDIAFRKAMMTMKPTSGRGKNKGPAGPAWSCAQCGTINRTLPPPKDDGTAHACTNKHSEVCRKHRVPMTWSYCGPSIHSLRASCAVYYLELGLSETEVMKITGHEDISVFRGYARLKTESIAAKMGKRR